MQMETNIIVSIDTKAWVSKGRSLSPDYETNISRPASIYVTRSLRDFFWLK